MPTEAEWEYACRAGSWNQFCFGDEEAGLDSYAWYDENAFSAGEGYAHEVGLKLANSWGLHDMHGNVYEWCLDRYDPDYYKSSRTDNPVGPTVGPYRVNRGGSWLGYSSYCRSATRFSKPFDCREAYIGFRVALIPAR